VMHAARAMGGRTGAIGRLTALQVQRLRKPGKYHDGGGLYFIVHAGGSRSFAFRYGRNGKTWAGLGPFHTVGLAEARERAKALRLQILDGIDPLAAKHGERQAARAAAAKSMSFADAAKACHQAKSTGWRNPRHAKEWLAALEKHAFPVLEELSVADIDTALVMKVVESIWSNKTETAARVRARIEQVLDWAKVRGLRSGENPARWKGHLDQLLPGRKAVNGSKNFAALPYAQAPSLMARLAAIDTIEARCLEFLILTSSRLAQACHAPWREFNLVEAKLWTIPEDRMKTGEEHIVPLCDRALEILRKLKADHPDSEFVFSRQGGRKPISTRSVWVLAKKLSGTTVHGFRSTFRDWATDHRADYPDTMIEIALAHKVGNETKRAYLRTKMIERRREMMAAWSAYCVGGRRHG
jgi:integrase